MTELAPSNLQSWLLPIGAGYFLLLMLLIKIVARGHVLRSVLHHPMVHVLGLGVSFGAWGLYVQAGTAYQMGLNYLSLFMGMATLFMCAPVILSPILRLVKNYHLHSLPDLFSFRYHSRQVGQVATAILFVVYLIYLAIQVCMIDEVVQGFGGHLGHSVSLYIFLILFILFLYRHMGMSEYRSNRPFMLIVAIQSLIKMGFLIFLGVACLFWVFDSPRAFDQWLHDHPEHISRLYTPLNSGTWQITLILFSFMTLLMPHMYQATFVENTRPDELNTASWGLSLYLLPIAIFTPIIMWAAIYLGFTAQPDQMLRAVTLSLNSPAIALFFYIAMLSAVCSSVMVGLLALSGMVFHHLMIGFYRPRDQRHTLEAYIRQRKFWLLMLVSVLTGCLFLLIRHENLQQLGMSVFSGLLVLLPALIGVLFWPNANRLGCLVSLIVGMLAWIVLQVLPFSFSQLPKHAIVLWLMQFEQEWLGLLTFFVATAGLVIGSMLSKQSGTEHSRALECAVYDPEPILRIQRWDISATCVGEMEHALSQQLGRRIALQQLRLALNHLGLSRQEQRPHQLTRLREQLNFNLSALLGPAAAQDMLDRALPYQARIDLPKIVMRHSLEQRLDQTPDHSMLSGAAAELDALRRFHRQTLHELPIGVCSVDQHLTLMGWNRVMSDMTGFGDEVIGWRLGDLPAPWGPVLTRFMQQPEQQLYRQVVEREHRRYLVNLQRAALGEPDLQYHVLVVEDVTQMADLEDQVTHQDRLAAIGRLVAGVAHEIGNPVTGIAGIAQNLEADFDDPEIREVSNQILEQTQRIRHIVSALVGYARTDRLDQAQRQALCLHNLVEESMSLTRMGQRRRINFINTVDPDLYISGYGPQLHQVFINLFSNAIDASQDQPKGIRIHVSAHKSSHQVHIEIEDDGMGLPDGDLRAKLFEPFVTTKQYGQGTGLGLSLVQGIINSHGGRIQLIDKMDYDQGQGVIVQLTLPAADHVEST